MPEKIDDRQRRLIPRWRPFRQAARLGLLDPARSIARSPLEPRPGELEELVSQWERHRALPYATELIDAALVLRQPTIAAEAARFVLENGITGPSKLLAEGVLHLLEPSPPTLSPPSLSREDRYPRIAALKRLLRLYPRDAIAWVDLARHYSALGQVDHARRAMSVAVGLAPDDRFVLGAATRFHLHDGSPDVARGLLLRSDRTKLDPWLMAAEISTATLQGKTSRLTSKAATLVHEWSREPRHISELAGAIGTLEHEHGNRRSVRRLFARALEQPTENTVAQASWILRHESPTAPVALVSVPENLAGIPLAYEARAWNALIEGRYAEAIALAWKWLADEPFAARPAMLGSNVASTALGDFSQAIDFTKAAELANPDDPRVHAQLAYCYAANDQLSEAEHHLSRMTAAIAAHPNEGDPLHWEVVMSADRGLIAYRRGDVSTGRRLYGAAIRLAVDGGRAETAAFARLHFAREEAHSAPEPDPEILAAGVTALAELDPMLQPYYQRLLTGGRGYTTPSQLAPG